MSLAAAPLPVEILIPPAEATKVTAFSMPSVEDRFTLEPVAVMSMSSPAAAPVARMSMPPAEDVSTIESTALSAAVRLIEDPDNRSMSLAAASPPVDRSMPPLVDTSVIALATPSVDCRLTLDPVAITSISSPALAAEAKMSTPPALAVTTTAAALFLAEVRFSASPERISISWVSPPVEMSIPPAEAISSMALAAPWEVFSDTAPVVSKSSVLFRSTASEIVNVPPESIEIAPAGLIAKAALSVVAMVRSVASDDKVK